MIILTTVSARWEQIFSQNSRRVRIMVISPRKLVQHAAHAGHDFVHTKIVPKELVCGTILGIFCKSSHHSLFTALIQNILYKYFLILLLTYHHHHDIVCRLVVLLQKTSNFAGLFLKLLGQLYSDVNQPKGICSVRLCDDAKIYHSLSSFFLSPRHVYQSTVSLGEERTPCIERS